MPRFLAWVSLALSAASCATALQGEATPQAEAAPLWLGLRHGPYAVGFEQGWQLDHGRTYRTAFDAGATYGRERAPRPVLVQLWYPADPSALGGAAPMPYSAYFELAAPEPLEALAAALSSYARNVLVGELFGVEESELGEHERALLLEHLATPTACRVGAPAAEGPFPLLVYHSGAGSSYEDNAVLCEYLASHGWVVASSAYPAGDGSSFNIDAGQGSFGDIEVLIRVARERPYVDRAKLALAGHSLGAQAILRYCVRPGAEVDALVLLDTTQDYYALGWPSYRALVEECLENKVHLEEALLAVAGPEAVFALTDRLTQSERTYFTLSELGHNEFISQGMQTLWVAERRANEFDRERADLVRAGFVAVCEFTRAHLDVHAAGRARTELDTVLREYGANPLGGQVPHVELMPVGSAGPGPFQPGAGPAVTPRQFARILREQGVGPTLESLRASQGAEPPSQVLESSMLTGSHLLELLDAGREAEARELYAGLVTFQPRVLSIFTFQATFALLLNRPERAADALRSYLYFEPDDAEVRARLEALEGR